MPAPRREPTERKMPDDAPRSRRPGHADLADSARRARRSWLVALALATAAGVAQLLPFLAGHNLTADDTMFQQFAREMDWAQRVESALGWATARQRIPLFFSNLVSISLGGWIDTLASRIANLAVFAACLAALAVHLARLFGAVPALAFALVAVAVSPLAWHHMPPTSYPFFPTVQALAWLLLRLAVLRLAPGTPLPRRIALRAAEGLALLSSEYVLFFAAPLMAMQWLHRAGPSPRGLAACPLLRGDVAVLAAVIAIQVAHRIALPGTGYIEIGAEGFGAVEVAQVAALHAWHGTVFPYLADGAWIARPPGEIAAAVALGCVIATAALLVPRCRRPGQTAALLATAGLALAATVALPVAAMDKYLDWCLRADECAYIESRFAGWGLMLALTGPFAWLLSRRGGPWRALAAATLGALGTATLLNNLAVAERMHAEARPWRDAARLACLFPQAAGPRAEALAGLMTAEHIQWHPFLERETRQRYWADHLARLRAARGPCAHPPSMAPGTETPLDGTEGRGPWVIGWGKPEGYHRLSAARHGVVALGTTVPLPDGATLVLALEARDAPERVEVRTSGGGLCSATLRTPRSRLAVPIGPRPGGTTIAVLVSLPEMAEGDAPDRPQAALRPAVRPRAATLVPDGPPAGAVPCRPRD